MISSALFTILGILIFLFLFWKRLKEDYVSGQIFNAAFYMLLGIFLGKILATKFFPDWWFWASFFGALVGVFAGVARFKLRILETFEAATLGLLPWIGLVFLREAIKTSSPNSFFASLVIFGLILLFFFFDSRYKKFTWYKSGRIGFSGLMVVGIFFLTRAAIAPIVPDVISFAGKYEAFFSGIFAFTSFLLVFNLARR